MEAVQSWLRGRGKFCDIERALEEGADPNEGEGDKSPLRSAIKGNQAKLLELLIRKKVDLNRQDAKGVGALHVAVFMGRSHLVQLLLDGGADANLKDIHGQTPIFFAPTRQICEQLLSKGAELTLKNLKDQTPLHHSSHAGLHDVVVWFVEILGDKHLDVADANGETPLSYAARSKVKNTSSRIKLTLEKKAQVMSPDVSAAMLAVATSTVAALAEDAANLDDSLVRDVEMVEAESSFHSHAPVDHKFDADSADVLEERDQDKASEPELLAEAGEKIVEEAVEQEASLEVVKPLVAVDAGDKGSDGSKLETVRIEVGDVVWHKGIMLTAYITPEDDYTCSVCGREFPEGTLLYGNRDEDYDVFPDCLRKSADGESPSEYGEASNDGASSFTSEHLFAEQAQAQIEEYDGCLYWQVLLKKEQVDDTFGFVHANGREEFETRLGQTESGEVGSSQLSGPDVLIVRRIKPDGLLRRWNDRIPELGVQPFDRIIGVNDETSVEAMISEFTKPRVMLQIERLPQRFIVTLSKETGLRLGFKFDRPRSIHFEEVRITEILEDGCMMAYNAHQVNAGRFPYVVLPGMRIDRVNACEGDAEAISNELKEAQIVDLHIRRCETSVEAPARIAHQVKAMNSVAAAFKNP